MTPEAVIAAAVIGASAESSASLKATAVEERLIAGKLDVVPPSCSRPKSDAPLFVRRAMPEAFDRNASSPVHTMDASAANVTVELNVAVAPTVSVCTAVV